MKKKICFIVASPETAKIFLLKHFDSLSHDFDIYLVANFEDDATVSISSPYIKEVKNIRIYRNISILKDVKALFSLVKYLHKMQFDAVHSVTPKAGLIGILAGKLAGIPVRAHTFTGQVWHTKKGFFKFFLKSIDHFIVYCATHILIDGESQRQFLIANKIVKENNSKFFDKPAISCVDTDKFTRNDAIRDKYRKELSFCNEVVFLFLGRLNVDKGVMDLAHAFSILNKKFANTRLVFVGPDEENLQPKIQEICNHNEAVVFYGSTTVPQEVLQMADVFCLPSYREGFCASIIEASSLEIPVICSDTYGLLGTIIENKTGLRHKVADVASILEQMEILVKDQELSRTLGENGRKYVLENFSSKTFSKQWIDFYKNVFST
jgi:glycosyltransferase involved in cell wall biosynthesis